MLAKEITGNRKQTSKGKEGLQPSTSLGAGSVGQVNDRVTEEVSPWAGLSASLLAPSE